MSMFNKAYNLRIIAITIGVAHLFSSMGYALRVQIDEDHHRVKEKLSSNQLSRRQFLKVTAATGAAASAPFIFSKRVRAEVPSYNLPPFSVEVVASLVGPSLRHENIVESSVVRSVHINTDLNMRGGYKFLKWQWTKAGEAGGDSFAFEKWDDGAETVDLSNRQDDLVFRFIISGTQGAQYQVIFQDNMGQRITVHCMDFLEDTYPAEQYFLIPLHEIKNRNRAFNWAAVKPPRFRAFYPQEESVLIKDIQILDVGETRSKGMGIGMHLNRPDIGIDGNSFPALAGYTGVEIPGGRYPFSVHSFSNLLDTDMDTVLSQWRNLKEGQVPLLTEEIWLPTSSMKATGIDKKTLEAIRKRAEERKLYALGQIRSLRKSQIDDYFEELSQGESVFKRILAGEVDEKLTEIAQGCASYGKTVMLRLFHEMMGGWYAWSVTNKEDADDFIATWRYIVDIFRENGATNVAFVFSPHTFEPDYLPQTRNFQLLNYILCNIQEDVNVIGIDVFSYPPWGGLFNGHVTEILQVMKKYNIHVIMSEMSSGIDESEERGDDKREFWNITADDSGNGMFPDIIAIEIFSEDEKFENEQLIDFRPPADIMEDWETKDFFNRNPFIELSGGSHAPAEGIAEPSLPNNFSQVTADWINDGWGNVIQFTVLSADLEECAWKRINFDWYGWGQVPDIEDSQDLNNESYVDYEFTIPMEIHEGEFELIFDDQDDAVVAARGYGNQYVINSRDLSEYIIDGRLTMSLNDVVTKGVPDIVTQFNWAGKVQIAFHPLSDIGKKIEGRSVIRKQGSSSVKDIKKDDRTVTQNNNIIEIKQNYPNPFTQKTTIEYKIKTQPEELRIEIFNNQGQLVKTSTDRSGVFIWDGTDNNGLKVRSGNYLIRIYIKDKHGNEGYSPTKKMIRLSSLGIVGVWAAKNIEEILKEVEATQTDL